MAWWRDSAGRRVTPTCKGGIRHWFAYPGQVGTSSPVCTRYQCDASNPNYRPEDDPFWRARWRGEPHPETCWCNGTGVRENGAPCNMTKET